MSRQSSTGRRSVASRGQRHQPQGQGRLVAAVAAVIRSAVRSAKDAKPEYRPKFCRARGCGLPFEHEGDHGGRARRGKLTAIAKPANRNNGRSTVEFHRPKAVKVRRDPAAVVRMDAYRRRPVRTDHWKRREQV